MPSSSISRTHSTPSNALAYARPVFVRPPARTRRTMRALASDVGQGTVEYVGLLLLMATVLAAVVAVAGELGGKEKIGAEVVTQIGKSIEKAGGKK